MTQQKKLEQTHKRRCKAMIDAGIDDPDSQRGIDFCVNECPYDDYCVVFESEDTQEQLKARDKSALVGDLVRRGIAIDDVAIILGVRLRTVQRYLKK